MQQIRRLAIVNRGEAAVRALTAVAELNETGGQPPVRTVLPRTDADAGAWHAHCEKLAAMEQEIRQAVLTAPRAARQRLHHRRRRVLPPAQIGRAVTSFRGPIVFVAITRYHGGAFVVFSKRLNDQMETAAVEGSFASVIGGAPAAATSLPARCELAARPIHGCGDCASS